MIIVFGYIKINFVVSVFFDEKLVVFVVKVFEGGMDVDKCVDVIVWCLNKGDKEIVVGEGCEMFILLIKCLFLYLVF